MMCTFRVRFNFYLLQSEKFSLEGVKVLHALL
jgi:hypothetical protein